MGAALLGMELLEVDWLVEDGVERCAFAVKGIAGTADSTGAVAIEPEVLSWSTGLLTGALAKESLFSVFKVDDSRVGSFGLASNVSWLRWAGLGKPRRISPVLVESVLIIWIKKIFIKNIILQIYIQEICDVILNFINYIFWFQKKESFLRKLNLQWLNLYGREPNG